MIVRGATPRKLTLAGRLAVLALLTILTLLALLSLLALLPLLSLLALLLTLLLAALLTLLVLLLALLILLILLIPPILRRIAMTETKGLGDAHIGIERPWPDCCNAIREESGQVLNQRHLRFVGQSDDARGLRDKWIKAGR